MDNALLSVIEKIKKLRALAANNPNENEAVVAAAMADRLLQEYRIAEADLDFASNPIVESSTPIYSSARRTAWKSALVTTIAAHYGCRVLIHQKRGDGRNIVSAYTLIGRKNDIEIARYQFSNLLVIIETLMARNARGKGHAYSQSYAIGIVSAIATRFADQRAAAKATVEHSTAIAKLDSRLDEAGAWMKEQYSNLKTGRSVNGGQRDSAGLSAGYRDGQNVRLGQEAEMNSGSRFLLNS